MKWRVDRERPVPEPYEGWGWDIERAIGLDLKHGRDEQHVLIVGYDVNAPTIMARVAALPHLDDDKPPKRLRVGRDGQIVVVE